MSESIRPPVIPVDREEDLAEHEIEHLRREMDSARFMGGTMAARLERAGLR